MTTITVKGMHCNHCVQSVKEALAKIPGISNVQVELATGKVTFESNAPAPQEAIAKAITAIGFEVA